MDKQQLDSLLWQLNRELRKRMRKVPYGYKVNMYIVGGASVIARYSYRASTQDVDAIWDVGSEMREAINAVAQQNGLPKDGVTVILREPKAIRLRYLPILLYTKILTG